ncbi:MAG TPA: ribose-5-phosphate isomerase RpiA [Polyangiaceae bacterium]|nr:ribose-5-phosphate isomerase RpiA [Polyangiaceae bacterium]
MDQNEAKRLAARAALELLPAEGVIGLGSGSTAKLFIDAVGERVRSGARLVGVATSEASRSQAKQLGIPLLDDEGPWTIDVCVDGADEVSAALDLIKGGGGCQTREKIVNQAARLNVIIVDDTKLSAWLGERWPVPIEVLAFAHRATALALEQFGRVEQRQKQNAPWRTDSGNFIYDVHSGPIRDPRSLDAALHAVPGVVETGLFCGRAQRVIVAGPDGIRELQPPA